MPTTLSGLVVFAVLSIPGFLHYVQRRALVPLRLERAPSPLVEAATLASVSIFTNALALGCFGIARMLLPHHTPEVRRLILDGAGYAAPRVAYLLLWASAALGVSSGLAMLLGRRPGPVRAIARWVTPPVAVDVSAWTHLFEEGPRGAEVYVGCDLRDGSYVGGLLAWYSTQDEETPDRDLVVAEPITYRPPGAEEDETISGFSRLVISARDVKRLYVSYIAPAAAPFGLADPPVAGEAGLGAD